MGYLSPIWVAHPILTQYNLKFQNFELKSNFHFKFIKY